ncbi:unnamed protein product [Cuscuta campestris]|uniref:Uncharacterized protein n=1 Tax=Cuscuta campestris TaxID=132261 RepID=A0A484K970_9ASTE|nr:unnamed protein product [Cuscuta campestris]
MEDKESITEFHGRVRDLANEAERLGRPFEEDNLVLKSPPDAPVQEDEEFIQILDEDPLVAVSKVPFQKESVAKKSKKKVIPNTIPQRRSKRKLKLEEDLIPEAPPQKKQSSSSSPMDPAAKDQKFICYLTHTNTVSKIMARLLYKIKHNIPFDLGQLIFDQIMLFAAEKYKVNSIGLPYPTLLYSLLVSQGFSKEEKEEEDLEEPQLQVDSRHMEGKHHNDMEVAGPTTANIEKAPSLVKFLKQKLMQVKEELARTS